MTIESSGNMDSIVSAKFPYSRIASLPITFVFSFHYIFTARMNWMLVFAWMAGECRRIMFCYAEEWNAYFKVIGVDLLLDIRHW